jgi:catechol 2,3-dioxygenase-like lactoylglutathione lyase family enzyme
MFDHVTIRVSDPQASRQFYEIVLGVLGIATTYNDEQLVEWDDFSLASATDEKPPTHRLHLGFVAPSRARVDEFWKVGVEAGYRDDGEPGLRPEYRDDYYGSFLLDPDGNSAEAVHHDEAAERSGIDHLWMRVADVDAARRFYETIAPYGGFRLHRAMPERAQFTGSNGSFSVVAGRPTENVHLAFPGSENSAVDAFHRVATDAGYRDNGPPGERPMYHPGYYGAFVLDPDGNNVEVVSHNRRES